MSRKTNRGRRRRALGDHAKRQQRPMQEDEAIATQISALLTPALAKQKKYCRQLGLRDRIWFYRTYYAKFPKSQTGQGFEFLIDFCG